jgi:hypothetical protein
MNNPDHISESLEIIFLVKILKFFDVDPDPGSGIFLTRDPGWKKFGSGINISHPQQLGVISVKSEIKRFRPSKERSPLSLLVLQTPSKSFRHYILQRVM